MKYDTRHRKTPTLGDGGRPRSVRSEVEPDTPEELRATLPPTPIDKLLAADAGIYALSHDADLIDAVSAAGSDQFPIHVVANPEKLRVLVANGRCKIALVDADLLGRDLHKLIADLKAVEPTLVLLIAAPREAAEELIGLLAERVIHRLLIKPAAPGITRLLIESATARYLQLVHEEADRRAPAPLRAPKRRPLQQSKSIWPAWILAIAFVSLLVGVVFVGGLSGLDPDGTADLPQPGFPEPVDAGAVGDGGVAGRAIESEIGAPPAAAQTPEPEPEAVRKPQPQPQRESEREPQPEPQTPAAIAPTPTERAPPSAPAPAESLPPARAPVAAAEPPSEVARLLSTAWTRLRQNQLLAPPGDSARDHVERALALDPANADALALRAELAAAVAESARVALEAGDIPRAEQLADEAFRLGAASETLAVLDLDLDAARAAAARQAAARDAAAREAAEREAARRAEAEIRAARLAEEAAAQQLQAAYLATPAPPSELQVLAAGEIVYPPDALRREIEGWVDTEFIIGIDGVPREARVRAAEPPGVFDQAALAAVAMYRYAPFERDGRVYERLMHLRVRFGLR